MAAEIEAFPDHRADIQEVVLQGARVVVLARMTGTHEGPFAGLSRTGRRFDVRAFQLFRVEGGLIVEHWTGALSTD
jgi:predicted ester cyclase